MTKKKYLKPAMQVVKIHQHAQLLSGSVTEVKTFGLDIEDELGLPSFDLPDLPGKPWEEAL